MTAHANAAVLLCDGKIRYSGLWLLCVDGTYCIEQSWMCGDKKPRYWPYLVPGEAMDRMFDKQEVGASMAISGQLNGKEYFLWGLKEPSYVMKMMVTGGPLVVNDDCEPQKRYWTEGGVEKFKMT